MLRKFHTCFYIKRNIFNATKVNNNYLISYNYNLDHFLGSLNVGHGDNYLEINALPKSEELSVMFMVRCVNVYNSWMMDTAILFVPFSKITFIAMRACERSVAFGFDMTIRSID